MTTTHPSANDSGLNLDHSPVNSIALNLEAQLRAVVRERDALRAALANQPAPTVPDEGVKDD